MRERVLREFHAAHAGITARTLWRAGSYHRLAACVPADARILELGCGDGALITLLGPRAVGLDVSAHELAAARARDPGGAYVQGRAQALPFARAAFEHVVSHLAFMLMDDADAIVAELARVLVPGGSFVALLGGGPVAPTSPDAAADAADAFRRFLARGRDLLCPLPPLRDPRARTEAGWRALFAGWEVAAFERVELVLDGPFDEVWAFLAASYELHGAAPAAIAALRDGLRAELPAAIVPCRVVTWLARATRP